MNDKTKSIIKKIIMCIVAALVLFCAGICTEQCRCRSLPESGELTTELEQAKAELEQLQLKYEQQLRDVEKLREQARDVGAGVDESLGLVRQANESIGRLGFTLSEIGNEIGAGRNTIEQLKRLNRTTAEFIRDMQSTNSRLTAELERIQRSSSK